MELHGQVLKEWVDALLSMGRCCRTAEGQREEPGVWKLKSVSSAAVSGMSGTTVFVIPFKVTMGIIKYLGVCLPKQPRKYMKTTKKHFSCK